MNETTAANGERVEVLEEVREYGDGHGGTFRALVRYEGGEVVGYWRLDSEAAAVAYRERVPATV